MHGRQYSESAGWRMRFEIAVMHFVRDLCLMTDSRYPLDQLNHLVWISEQDIARFPNHVGHAVDGDAVITQA